jgi:hypothetical protein
MKIPFSNNRQKGEEKIHPTSERKTGGFSLSLRAFFGIRRNRFAAYLIISIISIWTIYGGTLLPPLAQLLKPLEAQASWYATGGDWTYRKALHINHLQVPNTDQTNFPVLVSFTDPLLKTAPTGRVKSVSGYDIIFTASDGSTKLDHEIEKYDGSTGEIEMWVRVPIVSHTADTTIYIYYGNASISTSQENKTGVWSDGGSNNFKSVWHMKDTGTNPVVTDSTVGASNSTSQTWTPTASGLADGAGIFNGASQYINFGAAANARPTTAITVSAWVKFNALGSRSSLVMRSYNSVSSGWENIWLDKESNNTMVFEVSNGYEGEGGGGLYNWYQSSATMSSTGQWYYLVGTWSNTGSPASDGKIYMNGSLVSNTLSVRNGGLKSAILYGPNSKLYLATYDLASPGNYFNGTMDEVRISNVARSADWIKTEYNNMNTPATFITVDGEEVAISNDANLSNIVLSDGTLSPSFYFGASSYTASVGNGTSSITVTPTASKGTAATITVNGATVVSGMASSPINLNTGSNLITIVVTAPDNILQDTYTVTVTRALSSNANLGNLAISSGTLSPSFASGTISYTDSVPGSTTYLTVTPTVSESHATVTVNGNATSSGSPSSSIALSVGSNTVTIIVTAQDGTQKTYSITVSVPDFIDHFTVTGSASMTAGTPQTVTVHAIGRSGQVFDYTGSHTLTFGGASVSGGYVPKCAGTDFGTGTALTFAGSTATCTMILYKVETPINVSVSEGSYNATGHTLSVTVNPASVGGLSFGSGTYTAVSGNAFGVSIYAKDIYGNTATNASPSIALSADHGGSVSPTPVTATNGTYNNTITISNIYADTNGVVLTASTNSGAITATTSINMTGVDQLDHFSLSGSTAQAAGGEQIVTITAIGKSGNTYADYAGNRSFTFSGATAANGHNPTCRDRLGADVPFGDYTSISFTNGQGSCAMILYKAEVPLNINAGEFGKDATGHTLAVTVIPVALASLNLSAPSSVASQSSFSITITAKDQYGNSTMSGLTNPVALTVDHGGSVSPASIMPNNFSAGIYNGNVTLSNLHNASSVVLTASTNGGDITAPASITVVPAGWYVSGGTWVYRKPITITNSSGSTLSGYQIKLNLNTSGLVPAKMKSDCSNMRFAGSDGTAIPYFIEDPTKCGTASTVVWVKPVSLAVGVNTIYMYYGDAAAISASDGSSVFDFYDGFDTGTTVSASKWNTNGSPPPVSGGYANFSGPIGTGSELSIISKTSFDPNKIQVDMKMHINSYAGNEERLYFGFEPLASINIDGRTAGCIYKADNYHSLPNVNTLYAYYDGDNVSYTPAANGTDFQVSFYNKNANRLTAVIGSTSVDAAIGHTDSGQVYLGGQYISASVDWIGAHKYVASVPASTVGGEENISPNDANLSGLVLSAGALTPSFDPAVVSYSASVVGATDSVTVTPTVAAGGSTVTVNGNAVTSGSASPALALSVGSNTVTIRVTAQDAGTKTYTLTVNRATPPQNISSNNSVINVTQIVTSEITISAPANVIMSPAIAGMTGGTANGSATWTVKTNNAAGFIMKIKASTTPALTATGGSFADYTQASTGIPDFSWSIDNTDSEFGYTVEPSVTDDTTTLFKDDGNVCNTGALNTTDKCWAAFNTDDTTILNRSTTTTSSGEDAIVKLRAQSGPSHHQIQGNYQATVTVTALAN